MLTKLGILVLCVVVAKLGGIVFTQNEMFPPPNRRSFLICSGPSIEESSVLRFIIGRGGKFGAPAEAGAPSAKHQARFFSYPNMTAQSRTTPER